jgi:hypothetical protein
MFMGWFFVSCLLGVRQKPMHTIPNVEEPPPTCDVNRDSGTASANGGWLRRSEGVFGQHSSSISPIAGLPEKHVND